MKRFYTAESVMEGHPDKLCDLIADSILDACLKEDENSRVACEVFPVPVLLIGYDFGKFINLKLLVLWRMGIIESPLLKRDISTDKVNKPANLFMLVLNELK